MTKRGLITGITGQDGSYLAELLLQGGYEVFGLVPRSSVAMAFGCPVVASRIGALPEVIEDGNSELLVEPSSPSAVATGIRRLLSEPELRRQIGQAGQQRQRILFNEKRFVAELLAVLEQVNGQRVLSQRCG